RLVHGYWDVLILNTPAEHAADAVDHGIHGAAEIASIHHRLPDRFESPWSEVASASPTAFFNQRPEGRFQAMELGRQSPVFSIVAAGVFEEQEHEVFDLECVALHIAVSREPVGDEVFVFLATGRRTVFAEVNVLAVDPHPRTARGL